MSKILQVCFASYLCPRAVDLWVRSLAVHR